MLCKSESSSSVYKLSFLYKILFEQNIEVEICEYNFVYWKFVKTKR